MAFRANKTEHSGAKHGRGAFYGHKWEAKLHSNKRRRRLDQTNENMPACEWCGKFTVGLKSGVDLFFCCLEHETKWWDAETEIKEGLNDAI